MKARVGLGVGQSEARAAVMRRGRITWRASRPVPEASQLEDVLVELLRAAPLDGFPRPAVFAAFGPSAAQIKRLTGIPAVKKTAIASGLVSANVGRFFLRSGSFLRATPAFRSGDDWWAAALDDAAVAAVQRACARLRLRLEGCQPTAALLAQSVTTGAVVWSDGAASVTLSVRDGVWQTAKREWCGDCAVETDFADAEAAARASARAPLVLRASVDPLARERRVARAALYVLALTVAVGAYLAPGLAAARAAAAAESRAGGDGPAPRSASPVRALNEKTVALAEIARVTAAGRSVVQLLGGLARALPDSTAIVSLRVDTLGASVTVLSSAASGVLPRLESVTGVGDVRVSGALTREAAGGVQLQRLGARFRFQPRE